MSIIPIFISSTFRDFHRERDELIASVLPALNDKLVEFGCRAEMIDLRWGVTASDDDERQAQVLEVCLKEIDRSRPLFVGLLGERYGWVPDEYRLTNATQEAGIADYPRGTSVTALEFEYGALRSTAGEAVFLERRTRGPVPPEWRDSDTTHVIALKERVRERCEVHSYQVDTLQPLGLTDFIQCATRVIGEKVIRRALEIAGSQSDPVAAAEALFVEDRLRAFGGRDAIVAATAGHLRSGAGVCLTGQSGVGKSAIWCASVEQLRKDGLHVVSVPVAASPEVSTMRGVFLRICSLLGDTPLQELSIEELEEHTRLALGAAAPLVFAVDGIDQIPGLTQPRFLANLPAEVSVLVSTTDQDHSRYVEALGLTVIEVGRLSKADGRTAVGALCVSSGRSLPHAAVERLVAEPRTPLWLRLAIGELSALDADDFSSINPEADPLLEIARLVTATVSELPPSTGALITRIVDRAGARFGAGEVGSVLSLVATSRSGLRPIDFEEMTGLNALTIAGIRRALSGLLVVRGEGGRLGLAHAAVRGRLMEQFVSASSEVNLHAQIAEHLANYEDGDTLCQEDRLWHLFRSGLSVAAVLNRASTDSWGRLSSVVLDSLSVSELDRSLYGLDASGVNFLSWTVHERKMAMRSEDRVKLCVALFGAACALAIGDVPDEEELSCVAAAAGCLADLPSVAGMDRELEQKSAKALSVVRELASRYPDSVAAQSSLALISMWFGRETADRSQSLQARRHAVQTWQWIIEREPGIGASSWLQFALTECGGEELLAGNVGAARASYEQALPLTRELLVTGPATPLRMVNVVNALTGLGNVAAEEGNDAESLKYFGEAARSAESQYPMDPGRGATEQLAITSRAYGSALFNAGDLMESHRWLDLSDKMFRAMLQIDPQNSHWVFGLDAAGRAAAADIALLQIDQAHARIAGAIDQASDPSEATRIIAGALIEQSHDRSARQINDTAEVLATEALWTLQFESDQASRYGRAIRAGALEALARARQQLGELDSAAESQRQAVTLRRELVKAHAEDLDLLRELAVAQTRLSYLPADSPEAFEDAVVVWRQLVIADASNDQWRRSLGHALVNLAQHVEPALAHEYWNEAIASLRPVVAGDSDDRDSRMRLSQSLANVGLDSPVGEGEALFEEAIRLGQELVDAEPRDESYLAVLVGGLEMKAVVLANSRRYKDAALLLLRAADAVEVPAHDRGLVVRLDAVRYNLKKVARDLMRSDESLALECAERADSMLADIRGNSFSGDRTPRQNPTQETRATTGSGSEESAPTFDQLVGLGLIHPHLTRPAWQELAVMVPLWFIVIVLELLVFL
ncbi:DUF4062 domain-containing protein [Mycobacterium sp. NPDC051198]